MSLKSDLNEALIALRRLKILEALKDAAGYIRDEVVIQNQLALVGYPVSVADLRDDLRHLRDRDCIRLDTPSGVWLATLTRTGGDVADGRGSVDGVARPGPGV
ncbi:hypothetical protein [Methylomagnum ishizawai]|uniref:VpaChn25_0724 family phage protein n=1 Tax=Methylomagnum ishizawai TaxID=1760988 RepID=UPI001C327421|nr:hypothetical protein [Methylomagnum ishizawai]BBL73659.1 hypothetical protein MishRS11D_07570 [Methylomagnum ishizawai]